MGEPDRWAIQAGWAHNGDTNHGDTFGGTLQRMNAAAKILENIKIDISTTSQENNGWGSEELWSRKVQIFSQNLNPTYFRILVKLDYVSYWDSCCSFL